MDCSYSVTFSTKNTGATDSIITLHYPCNYPQGCSSTHSCYGCDTMEIIKGNITKASKEESIEEIKPKKIYIKPQRSIIPTKIIALNKNIMQYKRQTSRENMGIRNFRKQKNG